MAKDLLTSVMQGGAGAAPAATPQGTALVLVGAGGLLGSALLAQALADGRLASVQALVHAPLGSSVRGLRPVLAPTPQRLRVQADCAVISFERARHSNGRDDVFVMPDAAHLLAWATALRACGVSQLVVVVPHSAALLPGALKAGFATHDEAAVAALGFGQLVLLRAADHGAPADAATSWPARFAAWWLSQLRWMVPPSQQPVRAQRLAALVIELAQLLRRAPEGTRVLPPELMSQAAAHGNARAVLDDWLHHRHVQAVHVAPG